MINIYKNYPLVLIVAAFCPYLSIQLGVRVDHLVIYPMIILMVLTHLIRPIPYNSKMLPLFSLWVGTFVFLVVRTIMDNSPAALPDILSEADNFIQPLGIMMVFGGIMYYTDFETIKSMLHKASRLLVAMLCLNTAWIAVGFMMDTHPINEYFWRGPESVAVKAEQMGRYSGIFNQPAEAGMAYSIGLLALVYILSKTPKIKLNHVIAVTMMMFGGVVTVSKIFLFGGIPLFFIAVFYEKSIRRQIFKLFIWSAILVYPPYYYIANTWDGLNFLLRFVDGSSNGGLLNLITAGRFGGDNSQQSNYFSAVWDSNPLIGEGLGKIKVVDTAFFHFFANGGLIAITVYIVILIALVYSGIQFLIKCKFNSESKFFALLVLTVIGGSFGVPVFTLNRSSIILWVFVCLLYQYARHYKTSSNLVLVENKKVA